MRKVKQGHTKFQAIVYEPGKLSGYDNEYVACVHECFVTKVVGDSISFTSSNGYPYFCTHKAWSKKNSTRRQAQRQAMERLKEVTCAKEPK